VRDSGEEILKQRDEVAFLWESGQERPALLLILRVFRFRVARKPKKGTGLERSDFLPAKRVNPLGPGVLQVKEGLLDLLITEPLPAACRLKAKPLN